MIHDDIALVPFMGVRRTRDYSIGVLFSLYSVLSADTTLYRYSLDAEKANAALSRARYNKRELLRCSAANRHAHVSFGLYTSSFNHSPAYIATSSQWPAITSFALALYFLPALNMTQARAPADSRACTIIVEEQTARPQHRSRSSEARTVAPNGLH